MDRRIGLIGGVAEPAHCGKVAPAGMLTREQILDLAKQLASDYIERKCSASGRKTLQQIECAFANDMLRHNKLGTCCKEYDGDLMSTTVT